MVLCSFHRRSEKLLAWRGSCPADRAISRHWAASHQVSGSEKGHSLGPSVEPEAVILIKTEILKTREASPTTCEH